jgi:hypothetical protein
MQTICREQELASDLIGKIFNGSRARHKWKYLDAGSYRFAYRGEDGNVYKIPLTTFEDHIGENEREINNYERLRSLSPMHYGSRIWTVAPMQLFTFPEFGDFSAGGRLYHLSAIVMPYVSGKAWTTCDDKCGMNVEGSSINCAEHFAACEYFDLFDLAYENVRVQRNGNRVIIDVQC